jgi:hypothetical protein
MWNIFPCFIFIYHWQDSNIKQDSTMAAIFISNQQKTQSAEQPRSEGVIVVILYLLI